VWRYTGDDHDIIPESDAILVTRRAWAAPEEVDEASTTDFTLALAMQALTSKAVLSFLHAENLADATAVPVGAGPHAGDERTEDERQSDVDADVLNAAYETVFDSLPPITDTAGKLPTTAVMTAVKLWLYTNGHAHLAPGVTFYRARYRLRQRLLNGQSFRRMVPLKEMPAANKTIVESDPVLMEEQLASFHTTKTLEESPNSMHTMRFDGGSRGNPGKSGAGALLFGPGGAVVSKAFKYLGRATCNEAEYQALICGLELAVSSSVQQLTVEGDSLLVIQQLRGKYAVRASNLYPLYRRSKALAARIPSITFRHIRRRHNGAADALANRAMNTRSSSVLPGDGEHSS
jgi:ribonuclease HI